MIPVDESAAGASAMMRPPAKRPYMPQPLPSVGMPMLGATTMATPPAAAPTPAAPSAPSAAGVPTSPYTASSNLLGTQVNPTPSARLAGAQGATDAARGAAGAYDLGSAASRYGTDFTQKLGIPSIGFQGVGTSVAPRVQAAMNRTDAAAGDLANVDRFKLAQERFNQSAADSAPAYDFANRVATQRNAAGGRLKSGMLRTDYGNLDLARARDLDSAKTRFLQDALEGTIADQFNKTNALSGLEGQAFGQDASLRGEQRTERDASTGLAERNAGRQFDATRAALEMGLGLANNEASHKINQYGVAQSGENAIAGQEAGQRNEVRGERGFQKSMSDTAFEQGDRMASAGSAGNPAAALSVLSGQYGADGQAGIGNALKLLQDYLARNKPADKAA